MEEKYYEAYYSINNEVKNIIIKGIKEPTKKELAEFLKDMIKKISESSILSIGELSKSDAEYFYNSSMLKYCPVFGNVCY